MKVSQPCFHRTGGVWDVVYQFAMQHGTTAMQYALRRPTVLATIVVSTISLIALQVVLVVKVADWMSRDTGTAMAATMSWWEA